MVKGIAASGGIGIGRAVRIFESDIVADRQIVQDIPGEKKRFLDAAKVFVEEMEHAVQVATRNVGASEAGILAAQVAILQDPELTKEVLRTIERDSVCAEYAFKIICDGYIAMFSSLEDELISARSADFKDIKQRMLSILRGVKRPELDNVPDGSVLIAEDIPPSHASAIDATKIRGIATQYGTRFSHIAILARALGIPTVMGVQGLMEDVRDGDTVLVDGDEGAVTINPTVEEEKAFRQREEMARRQKEIIERYRGQLARTKDGHRVRLCANLAMTQELQIITGLNPDGVGLFRTEFLYMDRSVPPSEEQQYEIYSKVAAALGDRQVIIRTLDAGGDKAVPCLGMAEEKNPYLGCRAVRYCLHNPECFKQQLAAILRAGSRGNVSLMIPMISSHSELMQVKELVARAAEALERTGAEYRKDIPFGIMVETPAAVLCADSLAREVDFFSIGTNDLTQYILAVDRNNECVAHLYSHRHPAVLKAVMMTVRAAEKAGIPVKVCGEAAADPAMIPILLAMGVTELSVSSGALLAARYAINNLSIARWKERLSELLALETLEQVDAFILRHAAG